MTDTDWHDAQVIEATTPDGRGVWVKAALADWWRSAADGNAYQRPEKLSDVRVIVDADGNVAAPPITDETRVREWLHERWAWEYGECDHGRFTGGPNHGEPYAMCVRWAAALTAALRGEQQ